MVSDEQIIERIGELLATADLTITTTSTIRKQLEQDLHIDLSNRKAFVREQVDLYLSTHPQSQQEEEAAHEGDLGVEEAAGEESKAVRTEEETADEGDNEDLEEEVEEGEEEEEEERKDPGPEKDSKRLQAKIDRVKKESLSKEKKKRTGGGGFSKRCLLSPELQAVMGEREMPRTQVVKSLWVYIRAKNLQDPGNKRKINCDDRLEAVFGLKTIDMFKMNKLLTKHIWPLDRVEDEVVVGTKRPKIEPEDEGQSKPKRPKVEKKDATESEGRKGKGFTAPLRLSEALVEFLGTGERELSRSEVVKRMWAYIKENNLQDPSDKRQIMCDSKLKELFGMETFTGFVITKHLACHFLKD